MGAYHLVPWRHFFRSTMRTSKPVRSLTISHRTWTKTYLRVALSSGRLSLPLARLVGDDSIDVTTINGAGFSVPRRTSTPEPWKSVFADDGLSYYSVNTVDGTINRTPQMPEGSIGSPTPPSPLQSLSANASSVRGCRNFDSEELDRDHSTGSGESHTDSQSTRGGRNTSRSDVSGKGSRKLPIRRPFLPFLTTV